MAERRFVPLEFHEHPPEEMCRRSSAFRDEMSRRRSVRGFSARTPPRSVIEDCVRVAASAPSGANRQPWHFVVVADPARKRAIREAAEAEERAFYAGRAPDEWLDALAPLGTDAEKPFLEVAPYLVVIFAQPFHCETDATGRRLKNYYVKESVGIASGMLIAALHHSGLATLTHTPSPMGFLGPILGRPADERPFLLLVVGYPADDAEVPDISRKPLDQVVSWI